VYVETHSDHVINGIRVAARKKDVKREDVNIAFLKRVRGETVDGAIEEYSVIDNISVDENGELSHYPEGFLDEWTNQITKLYE
jgi:predicted ATPase